MTPPDPQQVAEVAGRLSKAQRDAVEQAVKCFPSNRYKALGPGATRKALRERGIGHGDWCYLTPLGLAVRNFIQGTHHD